MLPFQIGRIKFEDYAAYEALWPLVNGCNPVCEQPPRQRCREDQIRFSLSFSAPGVTERNRNWMPKIEGYLHSGKIYFAVAGAAHMGGSNGLVTLLRNRGYQIEQL